MASDRTRERWCARCARELAVVDHDGWHLCQRCYAETVGAEITDDMQRQRDAGDAEIARLTAENARLAGQVAALREAGEQMRLAALEYAHNGGDVLRLQWITAQERWRAAMAAGGEAQDAER